MADEKLAFYVQVHLIGAEAELQVPGVYDWRAGEIEYSERDRGAITAYCALYGWDTRVVALLHHALDGLADELSPKALRPAGHESSYIDIAVAGDLMFRAEMDVSIKPPTPA